MAVSSILTSREGQQEEGNQKKDAAESRLSADSRNRRCEGAAIGRLR
ncbi:hypothetical protein CSB93_3905 [Pseudomonas paraeruginosa]|uniref:Uncharacterized protein n=1 Tax=Pseudomonas paraeruginosa TaxID=2994495 RepID=A0A2R3IWZ3_9PSED|nr:hypothetical protein CSB93_3905 [Pseudomonas paraeruginosa]